MRGPRIDVEMLAADGLVGVDSEGSLYHMAELIAASNTDAFKNFDVTAITSEEMGRITFSWGNLLSKNARGNDSNRGGFLGTETFSRSCNELRTLNRYEVCLTSSELVIIPADLSGNSAGEQVVSCPDCTDMAFDGLNIWTSSSNTNQVYKIDLTREYSEQLTELCPGSLCHPNPEAPSITATVSALLNIELPATSNLYDGPVHPMPTLPGVE